MTLLERIPEENEDRKSFKFHGIKSTGGRTGERIGKLLSEGI